LKRRGGKKGFGSGFEDNVPRKGISQLSPHSSSSAFPYSTPLLHLLLPQTNLGLESTRPEMRKEVRFLVFDVFLIHNFIR
jgi:hypothetical protein